MKKLFVFPALIITTALAASVATANNSTPTAIDLYKVRYLKDCQTLSEKPMTQAQVDSYLKLEDYADQMDRLQKPISKLQPQLDTLSDKIKNISGDAVIENDTELHINKTLLQQQTHYAKQIEQLVSAHKKDFDALESMGSKISEAASEFEKQFKQSAGGLDYDNIQIISPTTKANELVCHKGVFNI
ncbi:hypothetical protein [Neptunicella marina]|uniref:OmpH family outer membrane protein n=1 Tax=Neptunicella marina TaxID=2125989 RepID=A0A8J6M571_9ALTE|nr:hypothetical protein [Neptunicella marina]MBC3766341.1 hypothetical protein [Neptunicella marina]